MRRLFNRIPLLLLLALCLTLGLAPFRPMPHLVEKLEMLFAGNLTATLDVFDLILHTAPWVLLASKLSLQLSNKE